MRTPLRLATTTIALTMLLSACTAGPSTDPPARVLDAPSLTAPTEALTVLAGAEGVDGIAASSLAFASSSVVVLADEPHLLAGASVAVALGVPLLSSSGADGALIDELDRLGVEHVVIIGETEFERARLGDREAHRVRADTASLQEILGIAFEPMTVPSAVNGLAELDRAQPRLLTLEDAPVEGVPSETPPTTDASATGTGEASDSAGTVSGAAVSDADDDASLPELEHAAPLDALLVLTAESVDDLASLATLRAAGAELLVLPAGTANPQASAHAVQQLAEHADSRIVAIGDAFAQEPSLDWKLRSAQTGLQLPGGGQLLFPEHQLVALYGTPGAPVLGVLGEQELPAAIERAKQHAAPYAALSDRTVMPAFEIIATIASAHAGADGNYSNELPPGEILNWAQAAQDAGMYVIIDLQPGYTDFVTQAKQYEEVLTLPWVGLALDPEWRLAPGQRHLVHIGSVHSSEVNAVQDYLTELVHAHDLPPKLLVLHQFRLSMLADRAGVETDRPEVTVLIHVDGQGSQPQKQVTWQTLHADAPVARWGWKNFYDEDAPMLTPEQTAAVEPLPDLITYQ